MKVKHQRTAGRVVILRKKANQRKPLRSMLLAAYSRKKHSYFAHTTAVIAVERIMPLDDVTTFDVDVPSNEADGDDLGGGLRSAAGGGSGEDPGQDAAAAMREQRTRKAAKRGHGQALATGHEHVLAQLYGPAGDADDDERLQHALVRGRELVAVDHGDCEHELDLLLQRVDGLARDGPSRDPRAPPWPARCR